VWCTATRAPCTRHQLVWALRPAIVGSSASIEPASARFGKPLCTGPVISSTMWSLRHRASQGRVHSVFDRARFPRRVRCAGRNMSALMWAGAAAVVGCAIRLIADHSCLTILLNLRTTVWAVVLSAIDALYACLTVQIPVIPRTPLSWLGVGLALPQVLQWRALQSPSGQLGRLPWVGYATVAPFFAERFSDEHAHALLDWVDTVAKRAHELGYRPKQIADRIRREVVASRLLPSATKQERAAEIDAALSAGFPNRQRLVKLVELMVHWRMGALLRAIRHAQTI
jgi:hypothetical protein